MTLRKYQSETIAKLYDWLSRNPGNPCLVLPTGAGKSVIIAELCRSALTAWPDTRILMITHVQELIAQNLQKLLTIWPNAPVGVYSAGIGKKELGEPITFAGIQSIRSRPESLGHVDVCLVDEAHLISHKEEGGYRELIAYLQQVNPSMRVIGLTATPYRLGHGLITDDPAIFDELIEPVGILYLQRAGYLADLRSKVTDTHLSVDGVHKRGGDYIESELQAAVDTDPQNTKTVDEIIRRAESRRHWLIFCAGVDHALHIRDALRERGVTAETVTGATPKKERERILDDFKAGRVTAVTNANVLTTGFDHPDIDLIAMLRPTCSPGLYVQMAGRGLRLKSHTDHCLVLDFAGVVETHGPIVAVRPPAKKGEGSGEAPTKACPECFEILYASARVCDACGYEFPAPEPEEKLKLRDDDIMGRDLIKEMEVDSWSWQIETSKTTGKKMVTVKYYGKGYGDPSIKEYFCVFHDGFAGQKGAKDLAAIRAQCGAARMEIPDFQEATPPVKLKYRKDGKYFRVVARVFEEIPF